MISNNCRSMTKRYPNPCLSRPLETNPVKAARLIQLLSRPRLVFWCELGGYSMSLESTFGPSVMETYPSKRNRIWNVVHNMQPPMCHPVFSRKHLCWAVYLINFAKDKIRTDCHVHTWMWAQILHLRAVSIVKTKVALQYKEHHAW